MTTLHISSEDKVIKKERHETHTDREEYTSYSNISLEAATQQLRERIVNDKATLVEPVLLCVDLSREYAHVVSVQAIPFKEPQSMKCFLFTRAIQISVIIALIVIVSLHI